ncbi:MAG: DoxX family membrane protein [Candidatus Melainabacteria bacterium]|nr:DoxX family membrane protein [Candidatus Melainabacteria bacterium]
MNPKFAPKVMAYLLILRWTLSLIFFVMGAPKLFDANFGASADIYFASLRDDIILSPYTGFFNKVVIPNAFIFASLVKYAELAIAGAFFIGFPMRLAVFAATFLHINYICIASFPSLLYLNVLMIVCEWVCLAAVEASVNNTTPVAK